MAGSRRRSREVALQILFQLDSNLELAPEDAIDLYYGELANDAGGRFDVEDDLELQPGPALDEKRVRELVLGVAGRRDELDGVLNRVSRKWRVERMADLDRNILRLALFEMEHCEDVPVRVAINEAIELAKRFGSAEAGAFINGMLDRAVGELDLKR